MDDVYCGVVLTAQPAAITRRTSSAVVLSIGFVDLSKIRCGEHPKPKRNWKVVVGFHDMVRSVAQFFSSPASKTSLVILRCYKSATTALIYGKSLDAKQRANRDRLSIFKAGPDLCVPFQGHRSRAHK
jgi:hypothetical protein